MYAKFQLNPFFIFYLVYQFIQKLLDKLHNKKLEN